MAASAGIAPCAVSATTVVISEAIPDPSAVPGVDPRAAGTSTPRSDMPTKAAMISFDKPLGKPTTMETASPLLSRL